MHNRATESVLSAKEMGISQYEAYLADRITSSKIPLTDTIARNNLVLFHSHVENYSLKQMLCKETISFFLGYTLLAIQEK